MKLVKTQVCLYIYEELLEKGHVDAETIKNEYNLSTKTFLRYINEIRAYLCNFYRGKQIIYRREYQRYYLKSLKNDEWQKMS